MRFNFTSIGDLQSVEKETTVDVIGVLKDVEETAQVISKTTSKPYDKRELTLVDNTGFSVRLTVWGTTATEFSAIPESVIAFKGVKVSDFGGRSLSLLSSGSMTIDPDIEEAHKLKGWYDAQGRSDTFSTHASIAGMGASSGKNDDLKTIAQVREDQLGMSEAADYFALKATIIHIGQNNVSYPACEKCTRKVTELDPGQWHCEKCEENYPKPEYRYIVPVRVSDHTGQLLLTCFDESGRLIMGITANQLMEAREEDEKVVNDIYQEANCRTWVFRCKAKTDTFGDQPRYVLQHTVFTAFS